MPSKPKSKKPAEGELIPADTAPIWTVTSTEPDELGNQRHRLFYGRKSQATGRTPGHLRRFREIAEHNNARGLAPKPKIQCRADENLPAPPRRKSDAAPQQETSEPSHP